jgi:hypothetical protein
MGFARRQGTKGRRDEGEAAASAPGSPPASAGASCFEKTTNDEQGMMNRGTVKRTEDSRDPSARFARSHRFRFASLKAGRAGYGGQALELALCREAVWAKRKPRRPPTEGKALRFPGLYGSKSLVLMPQAFAPSCLVLGPGSSPRQGHYNSTGCHVEGIFEAARLPGSGEGAWGNYEIRGPNDESSPKPE